MKQIKLIKLFTAAILSTTAIAAFPNVIHAKAETVYGQTADKLTYEYDPDVGEVSIIYYNGSNSSVTVPAYIEGMPVTSITNSAFTPSREWLTSVTLPNTLKKIDSGSFYCCKLLESVNIPNSVTFIADSAFAECSSLTSVSIPASTTYIGTAAFSDCDNLLSVQILGPAEVDYHAFHNCEKLANVQLSDDSRTKPNCDYQAFSNCPDLYKVNGVQALQHKTDSNGIEYPVINPAIESSIRNHFSRSINVGFVDDYCTELCNYIVETETDDWMCDALKARQLHDWIIRHCEYEDEEDGENLYDNENHVASSVFLSYAINTRGNGVGETVCDGFAKAYTMLLTSAGIESYHIGHTMHAWNLVKIDGKFYHVDVTNDNSYAGSNPSQYGTNYTYFLKKSLHGGNIVQNHPTDHTLLMVYNNNVNNEIKNCPQNYPDKNRDGIMDDDFNLNGTGVSYGDFNGDLNAWHHWEFMFGGSMDTLNDKLPEIFDYLRRNHESYDTYLANSSPKNVSAAVNTTATFKVTLFGNDLTYQWQYYNTNTGKWENVNSTTAKTPTLKITVKSGMNNRQFGCIVTNKNGNCIYSDIAKLTVS